MRRLMRGAVLQAEFLCNVPETSTGHHHNTHSDIQPQHRCMMETEMSAVEDVAAAIAATVRERGLKVSVDRRHIDIHDNEFIATLHCQDASQAKRLAEMMRQPPEPVRGVFGAMGIDPVDPMDRFPSVRGKA